MSLDQGRSEGGGAGALLLPAIAAGERVAGEALVSPDEHMPVDAAPTEAEARCLLGEKEIADWVRWSPLDEHVA